jgi:hypothetical protein
MTVDGMARQRPRRRSGCITRNRKNIYDDGNPVPPPALGFLEEDHMSRRRTGSPTPDKQASTAHQKERWTARAKPERDGQNKKRNDASSGHASGKRPARNPLGATGDTHIKE